MYVLLAKVFFTAPSAEHDPLFYRHLAARIRARFRVCVQIYADGEHAVLALTGMALQADTLHRLNEQICALCEREGLGRVAAGDKPLIAHLDSLI